MDFSSNTNINVHLVSPPFLSCRRKTKPPALPPQNKLEFTATFSGFAVEDAQFGEDFSTQTIQRSAMLLNLPRQIQGVNRSRGTEAFAGSLLGLTRLALVVAHFSLLNLELLQTVQQELYVLLHADANIISVQGRLQRALFGPVQEKAFHQRRAVGHDRHLHQQLFGRKSLEGVFLSSRFPLHSLIGQTVERLDLLARFLETLLN